MRVFAIMVVVVVACSGGAKKRVDTKPAVGGVVPAKECALRLTDKDGTRTMRLLPSGQFMIGDIATGTMTANGEIKGTDGNTVSRMQADGTVQIETFPYEGMKVREDGVLLQEGKAVAQFGADGTLETKLKQNVDKTVAIGDASQRRVLMFMWVGIVMNAYELKAPDPDPR